MDFVRRREAGVTVVSASGWIDSFGASQLEGELHRLWKAGERDVRLDMGRVGFVDSTGIRVLLWGRRLFLEAGGRFRLACVQPKIRRTLGMLRLDRVLELEG